MAKLRIHRVEVAQQPGAKLRIHGVSIESVQTPTPNLGVGGTVESQTPILLTASVAGSPSAWVWTQTAGPTVTLTGSGSSRSFTAPATVDGTVITIQAVATISGVDTPPGSATFTVLPHQWWVRRSGVWQPFTLGQDDRLYPDTGLRSSTGLIPRL